VMELMIKGKLAKNTYGAAIDIDDKKVCTIRTIKQLEKHGLVEVATPGPSWCYRATLAGLAWSPED